MLVHHTPDALRAPAIIPSVQSAARSGVYALGPTILCEASPDFIRPEGEPGGFAWANLADASTFVPADYDIAPSVINTTSGRALRFGYGADLTKAKPGALRHDSDAELWGTGAFTIATVMRVPPRTSGDTGGVAIGNRVDASRSAWIVDYGNGSASFNLSGTQIITPSGDIADSVWRAWIVSHDGTATPKNSRSSSTIGAGENVTTSTAASNGAASLAKQVLIGGAGGFAPALGFIGDMAALVYLPFAVHPAGQETALAALQAYINEILARG